jgi:hypothetical protein
VPAPRERAPGAEGAAETRRQRGHAPGAPARGRRGPGRRPPCGTRTWAARRPPRPRLDRVPRLRAGRRRPDGSSPTPRPHLARNERRCCVTSRGCWAVPPAEATTTQPPPPSSNRATGFVRRSPDFAPTVVRDPTGRPPGLLARIMMPIIDPDPSLEPSGAGGQFLDGHDDDLLPTSARSLATRRRTPSRRSLLTP